MNRDPKEAHEARRGKLAWNSGKKGLQKAWNKGIPQTDGRKEHLRKLARERKVPPRLKTRGITGEQYQAALASGLKWCCYHKRFESREEFRNPKRSDPCRKGLANLQKEWRGKNWTPEYKLKITLAVHNASIEWYEQKSKEQEGKCALCHMEAKGRRFDVDHDRTCCSSTRSCGKCNRGLLCSVCNKRLGYYEGLIRMAEEIKAIPNSWLAKALDYLKHYQV